MIINIIFIIIYVIGYLICFRKVFYWAVDPCEFGGLEVEWEDVIIGSIVAIIISLFWPFLALGEVVNSLFDPNKIFFALASEPKELKIERLNKEKKEREEYIKNLERKLKIGEEYGSEENFIG